MVSFWLYSDTAKPAEIGGVYRVKKIGDLDGKRIIFGQPIHDTDRMFGVSFPRNEHKAIEKLVDRCVRKRIEAERLSAFFHHAIEISANELASVIPSVLEAEKRTDAGPEVKSRHQSSCLTPWRRSADDFDVVADAQPFALT